jgi:hypothetical protein
VASSTGGLDRSSANTVLNLVRVALHLPRIPLPNPAPAPLLARIGLRSRTCLASLSPSPGAILTRLPRAHTFG